MHVEIPRHDHNLGHPNPDRPTILAASTQTTATHRRIARTANSAVPVRRSWHPWMIHTPDRQGQVHSKNDRSAPRLGWQLPRLSTVLSAPETRSPVALATRIVEYPLSATDTVSSSTSAQGRCSPGTCSATSAWLTYWSSRWSGG